MKTYRNHYCRNLLWYICSPNFPLTKTRALKFGTKTLGVYFCGDEILPPSPTFFLGVFFLASMSIPSTKNSWGHQILCGYQRSSPSRIWRCPGLPVLWVNIPCKISTQSKWTRSTWIIRKIILCLGLTFESTRNRLLKPPAASIHLQKTTWASCNCTMANGTVSRFNSKRLQI